MENVPYAAFTNGEVRKPPAVVPDRNYSPLARRTIKEHSTITASAVFFHPETHSELRQAGHTPDVHIVTNAFCWKVKSVVCKIKEDSSDICSVRYIYLFIYLERKRRRDAKPVGYGLRKS